MSFSGDPNPVHHIPKQQSWPLRCSGVYCTVGCHSSFPTSMTSYGSWPVLSYTDIPTSNTVHCFTFPFRLRSTTIVATNPVSLCGWDIQDAGGHPDVCDDLVEGPLEEPAGGPAVPPQRQVLPGTGETVLALPQIILFGPLLDHRRMSYSRIV